MFSIFLIGFFPSAKFLLFRSLGSVSESSVKAPTYFLGKMKTSFLLSKTLDKTDILVYKSRYPLDPRNGGLILLPSGWIFDLVVSGCQYFLHKYQNKFHIPSLYHWTAPPGAGRWLTALVSSDRSCCHQGATAATRLCHPVSREFCSFVACDYYAYE